MIRSVTLPLFKILLYASVYFFLPENMLHCRHLSIGLEFAGLSGKRNGV